MENGPPTLGVEDGAVEVERLLVEPQDAHVSMDSVLCFNENVPQIAMGMEEVSPRYGRSNDRIAHEEGDVLSAEVLDAMPNELEVGYFQLQNDFCTMGEDYFLGVEFAESVTNLDYGSSEGLQTSVSGSPILTSSADTDMPWKSDVLRIIEMPGDHNEQLYINSSESSDIPSCHEGESVVEEKPSKSPKSSAIQNIGKFHDISNCSFQDILSDENDGSLSPSVVIFCSPDTQQKEGCGLIGHGVENNTVHGQEALALMVAQASSTDALPLQKRPRKPTQRYIDELASPFPRNTKKRVVSAIPTKDKSLGVKDHKKCCMESRALRLPTEESSVIAIQVPFGSLVHKKSQKNHAFDVVPNLDGETLMAKSKDFHVTPDNQKKRLKSFNVVCQKKMDDRLVAASLKKRDDCIPAVNSKKRDGHGTAASLRKREDCPRAIHQKKRGDYFTPEGPEDVNGCLRKREDCPRATHRKKGGDYFTTESPEEVNGCLRKREDCPRTTHRKKGGDYFTTESPEEVSGCLRKREDCPRATHRKKGGDYFTTESPEEVNGCLRKREDCPRATPQKKGGDYFTLESPEEVNGYLRKREDCPRATHQKKGGYYFTTESPEEVNGHLRKREDCPRATHQKKRGDYFTTESPEEVNGRRKHHRLWTISEVRKLIDGVSQYGVGRWSRIKNLFFSTSAHRTSVDLKDKWRNLLKASGIQEQGKRQGEKKRHMAWRPLPNSILRRVCELAIMYPYPKGRKPKISHIHHVTPDGSTDITLSDYIRILRSVNGD